MFDFFNISACMRWFCPNRSNSNLVMVGCACIGRCFEYADSTLRKFLLSLVHFFNQDWIHNLSTFHFTKEVSFPETDAMMSFAPIDALISTSASWNPVKTLCELTQNLLHSLFWVILRRISFITDIDNFEETKSHFKKPEGQKSLRLEFPILSQFVRLQTSALKANKQHFHSKSLERTTFQDTNCSIASKQEAKTFLSLCEILKCF